MSIGFYEDNAEDFFRRSVDADMARGHADFTALAAPGGRMTPIEASAKLAALASAHTGLPVEVMTFDQIAWRAEFDGVWACASLLHVPRADLPATLGRLRDALVPGGVLWMSFKYGTQERQANGRHFTDMDEDLAQALVADVEGLALISMAVTEDARDDRPGERWLSVLCRRA